MFAPNFTKEELIRSSVAKRMEIFNEPSKAQDVNLQRLSWFLQSLKIELSKRFNADVKIIISSGFRSKELNDEIGGSDTSAHMDGLAADITCSHMTPFFLARFISTEMRCLGFDQVIQEYGQWVHIGLTKPSDKLESLTAVKENGKTVYRRGIS